MAPHAVSMTGSTPTCSAPRRSRWSQSTLNRSQQRFVADLIGSGEVRAHDCSEGGLLACCRDAFGLVRPEPCLRRGSVHRSPDERRATEEQRRRLLFGEGPSRTAGRTWRVHRDADCWAFRCGADRHRRSPIDSRPRSCPSVSPILQRSPSRWTGKEFVRDPQRSTQGLIIRTAGTNCDAGVSPSNSPAQAELVHLSALVADPSRIDAYRPSVSPAASPTETTSVRASWR